MIDPEVMRMAAERRAVRPLARAAALAEAAERTAYLAAQGVYVERRAQVPYAWHGIPEWAVEELCRRCRQPAAHKVGDQSGPEAFHELTAYLCCGCMRLIGMDCALYPAH